jgi:hypothetical protein
VRELIQSLSVVVFLSGCSTNSYDRSARLSAGPGAPPVDPAFVDQFCAGFDPKQARFAPDRGE